MQTLFGNRFKQETGEALFARAVELSRPELIDLAGALFTPGREFIEEVFLEAVHRNDAAVTQHLLADCRSSEETMHSALLTCIRYTANDALQVLLENNVPFDCSYMEHAVATGELSTLQTVTAYDQKTPLPGSHYVMDSAVKEAALSGKSGALAHLLDIHPLLVAQHTTLQLLPTEGTSIV